MAALQTRICNANLRSSTHRPLNPKVGGIISRSTPFFVVNYTSGGKKKLLVSFNNPHHQQTLAGSQHTKKRKFSTLNNIVRTTSFLKKKSFIITMIMFSNPRVKILTTDTILAYLCNAVNIFSQCLLQKNLEFWSWGSRCRRTRW